MCRLRNIAMRDYQESVTIRQTDTHTHRQTPDKVIPMCRYASQATQQKSYNLSAYIVYLLIYTARPWNILHEVRLASLALRSRDPEKYAWPSFQKLGKFSRIISVNSSTKRIFCGVLNFQPDNYRSIIQMKISITLILFSLEFCNYHCNTSNYIRGLFGKYADKAHALGNTSLNMKLLLFH